MELFSISYFPLLLAVLIVIFAIREIATYKGNINIKYFLTPATTGLILGFVILSIIDAGTEPYRVLILVALILSLIADTMLMIVEVNLLKFGIIYFLSAHILFIVAFSLDYIFKPWNVIIAVILIALYALFYIKIKGKTSGMDKPILVYAAVICVMLFFAISSMNIEVSRKNIFILVGALLFVISDFSLALFSFLKPNKQETVIVWSMYAPAQFIIALSCFS